MDVRLGVSVSRPFRLAVPEQLGRGLRFHTPLIEPDRRISRIRLPDKALMPSPTAGNASLPAAEPV